MKPQILDVTVEQYHELPHFSSSAARVVISRSPAHAKAGIEKAPTKEMDRGQVVHRLVLGKGAEYEELDFPDFRTKDARAARDKARAADKIPILSSALADAKVTAEAIRGELAKRGIKLDGQSELAVTWSENTSHGPVQCKAMFDHVWLDRGVILDLKVTENAAPPAIERTAESLGYAIQCAAYTRALGALRPELVGRIDFLFAFCEPSEPHAINLCRPDGAFRELGEMRWLRAVETWGECLATGRYPAYGDGVNFLTAPAWVFTKEFAA